MANNILATLLARGDKVSIVNGKLVIEPKSRKPIPDDWLNINESTIVIDCLEALGINAYYYTSYTTGNYGLQNYSGLTLHFINAVTGEDAFVCFNANLKYLRNNKHSKKDSSLPIGQFSVTKRYGFYKFWSATKLPLPRSLTRFYERMGKLKTIIFSADILDGEKLNKKTIAPLIITYEQLLSAHNYHITSSLVPHKERITLAHKESDETHIVHGLQPNQSAREIKYGNKVIREHGYKGNDISPLISPKDQSIGEWLKDYEA